MISYFWIYICTLPKEQQIKSILIMLSFFVTLLVIGSFLYVLKLKFVSENKKSIFQKFLKRL